MKTNKLKINLLFVFISFFSCVAIYFLSFYYSYNGFYKNFSETKKIVHDEKEVLNSFSFSLPPDFLSRDREIQKSESKISIENLDEFFEKKFLKKGIRNMWESTSKENWVIRNDPLTSSDWYIVGVVSNSISPNVFISRAGEKIPFSVYLGQHLPDGSILKSVKKESISVLTIDNSLIHLPIFD